MEVIIYDNIYIIAIRTINMSLYKIYLFEQTKSFYECSLIFIRGVHADTVICNIYNRICKMQISAS
jgi:hypothetical protein